MPATTAAPLRGEVPNTYVRLLDDYLAQHGMAAGGLPGGAAPALAHQLTARTPVALWQQRLAAAATLLNDPLLGLHLGRTIAPRHFGMLGYVLLACGSLGAALQRFERYQRLFYDVNPLSSRLADGALQLSWGVEYGRPGALVDECAITALVQFGRDISGSPWPLQAVQFVNPAPANLAPYREYFGCEVAFAQPLTLLRIRLAALALPLRQPDAGLLAVLSQQAEALLAALPRADDFEQDLRRCVARLMLDGEPSLQRVAEALHTTPRTLHRRLQAHGRNFRALLEQTRHRLADDYLRDPRLQLAEIAQLLGFSEQSAFNRAYRRWSGTTPQQFRRRQRVLAQSEA